MFGIRCHYYGHYTPPDFIITHEVLTGRSFASATPSKTYIRDSLISCRTSITFKWFFIVTVTTQVINVFTNYMVIFMFNYWHTLLCYLKWCCFYPLQDLKLQEMGEYLSLDKEHHPHSPIKSLSIQLLFSFSIYSCTCWVRFPLTQCILLNKFHARIWVALEEAYWCLSIVFHRSIKH